MRRVIAWELYVLGSHGMAAVDYPAMLQLIAEGGLRPQELIERTISLADAAARLHKRWHRMTGSGNWSDPTTGRLHGPGAAAFGADAPN